MQTGCVNDSPVEAPCPQIHGQAGAAFFMPIIAILLNFPTND